MRKPLYPLLVSPTRTTLLSFCPNTLPPSQFYAPAIRSVQPPVGRPPKFVGFRQLLTHVVNSLSTTKRLHRGLNHRQVSQPRF